MRYEDGRILNKMFSYCAGIHKRFYTHRLFAG